MKTRDIFFFISTIIGAIMLVMWIMAVTAHKEAEQLLLKTEINKLTVRTDSIYHNLYELHGDTTFKPIGIPIVIEKQGMISFEQVMIIHIIVFLIFLTYIFYRLRKIDKKEDAEKWSCRLFQRKKPE